MEQEQGRLAILDALGAATYTDPELEKFLDSRGRVIELLHRSADAKEVRGDIEASQITTFTFNDTVLIVYRTRRLPRLADFKHFGLLLRKFCVDSLAKGILFRGSLSAGTFYVDDNSNTDTVTIASELTIAKCLRNFLSANRTKSRCTSQCGPAS